MVDFSQNDKLSICQEPVCLINGVRADFLSVHDRSIQFGDGIFETILCIDGQPVFWEQHMDRLTVSADRLGIKSPDISEIRQDIEDLIRVHGRYQNCCVVKIIITRGASRRGYKYPHDHNPRRIVTVDVIDRGYSSILSAKLLHGNLCYCDTPVSMNRVLAGIKHLNRLENVLARNEIDDTTYIDGIMLDDRSHVIECSMSNIFLVKQGTLLTPDLSVSGVAGVTREIVLELARNHDMNTIIGEITQETVLESSEMFITNSLIGMKSVDRLGDKIFDQHVIVQRLFGSLLGCLSSK